MSYHQSVWAPSDQALALCDIYTGNVTFVRDFSSGMLMAPAAPGLHASWGTWATPFSHRAALLLLTRGRDGLAITHATQPQLVFPLPSQKEYDGAAWGVRLVLQHSYSELHIFPIDRSEATLKRIITPGDGRPFADSLALSADGELCAVVTGSRPAHWPANLERCHLAVLHLSTETLQEYPLRDWQLKENSRLRWSPDCSAVLVSARDGGCHELFSLC